MMFRITGKNNKTSGQLRHCMDCVGCLALLMFVFFGFAKAEASDARIELPKPLQESDFRKTSVLKSKLGQLLFYDKILSGNQNISCATCHHHKFASADGLSLPVGEGGVGIGPKRTVGSGPDMIEQRVPRNSPSLFNLGAKEFTVLFHDGRVSVDPKLPSGFNTPADEDLPYGLANVMAAQAMFPVTSPVEMAGEFGENEVANAANRGVEYVWPVLEARLRNIPQYVDLFRKAFPDITTDNQISMVHVANALADFQMREWRSDQSPFDQYLRGDKSALSDDQVKGMKMFYGRGRCAECHSGALQTDHKFYAIAMPQLGYPLTRMFDPVVRDRGRINETDALEDQYKFRTPSLRNITATAPYGHSGAYRSLEAVVRHHFNPVASFKAYDPKQAILPKHPSLSKVDLIAMENPRERLQLLNANEIKLEGLTDPEIDHLLSFLEALTDTGSLEGKLGVPTSVPSRLSID